MDLFDEYFSDGKVQPYWDYFPTKKVIKIVLDKDICTYFNYCIDDLNLTECDLIMLDVEGYELHALNGAIETIKKYGPVICIEHAACWLERYNTSINEIENLLIDKLGYIYATSFSTAYSTDRIYVKTADK